MVWPEIETIDAVSVTLRDRINRLEVEITNIEENAKIYATSAEDLARYTRDAKVAEATYTVLIEQVKSQSLAAGFQPDTFKVFEYATTPYHHHAKRNVIFALGAVLGTLLGCSILLIPALRRLLRSTYCTNQRRSHIKIKINKTIIKKSIPDIISFISKRRIVVLDEYFCLTNKKIIYVVIRRQ